MISRLKSDNLLSAQRIKSEGRESTYNDIPFYGVAILYHLIPTPDNFPQWVKKLRTERNLSLGGMAKRTGVTRQAVVKWESGKALPNLAAFIPLYAMAIGLDTPIDPVTVWVKEAGKRSKRKA